MDTELRAALSRACEAARRERVALEQEIKTLERSAARWEILAAFALAFSTGFNVGSGKWWLSIPVLAFIPFWQWTLHRSRGFTVRRVVGSSYSLTLLPGFVVLEDLNGSRSITNDAENVIAELAAAGHLAGRRVVYRDSEGHWDELIHSDGTFVAFGPMFLNELPNHPH